MSQAVKVLFASGSDELIPRAIEQMREIFPELPLYVVSEFPQEGASWIPFHIARTFRENLEGIRAALNGKKIRISAVTLQPRMPYWRMRLIAFVLAPFHFLAFNENLGHFMLRPGSAPAIARHAAWRTRNFLHWQTQPGGPAYTLLWRLRHPRAFVRPIRVRRARVAGAIAAWRKRDLYSGAPIPPPGASARPPGISVVVPSRNGRDLLARLLPGVHADEVIIVDNGSSDGSVEFLKKEYPAVILETSAEPLSFARAANRGIARARFSHVCLLNNDMQIRPEFFARLRTAFDQVPDLFCATAQIFFPPGRRREETGKAVMRSEGREDFPVRCDVPVEGENLSYVLYGSGGCSLFDAEKLNALRGFDPVYEPAYVEDLDLGFRAWQRGWPSVFVSGAEAVHDHRATTSRYHSREELDRILEVNYLRFLARTIQNPRLFARLWREAVDRLDLLAAREIPVAAAMAALREARRAPAWLERRPGSFLPEDEILALGGGEVFVTPGRAAAGKPVVLIASPYLPFPLSHGGAVRMYNLMRRGAADFDQVLVCFVDEAAPVPPELRDVCVEIVLVKRTGSHSRPTTERPGVVEEFDTAPFHAALRQTVRKWRPRIAQLEFTQLAQYAPDCTPARTLLVEHDITFDLYQQLLAGREDWEVRRQLERWIPFERRAWERVDRVIAMSEKDRRTVGRDNAVVLPNGVDLERFRPSERQPEPRRLLFIGSFSHLPNVLAIEFFLREAWPRLRERGLTLHIIAGARHRYFLEHYRGRAAPDLEQPGIEVEDFVSDVRPAYERAAVVIAPLLASAGTNIKILEAMAMGKAIVSTPGGVNGLDLNPERDFLLADTGAEFAAAVLRLVDDPEPRRTIERQARWTVEERFSWDRIAEKQAALYRELL